MRFLVAICTYNRAAMLQETLTSLCAVQPPVAAAWSVLVINNRCSDDTDQVIAAFNGRLPIERGYEPTQGLSHARNAVVDSEQAARADYVIWTDDDVRVEPQWLREYEHAFVRSPESCVFGGDVTPWFETDPPTWLMDGWVTFRGAFSVRQFEDGIALEAHGPHIPYGANFAIRAAEQRRVRYDPKLGVTGEHWLGGEEVDVMRQLLQQGHTGWWVARAAVRHFVPRERMTMKFLGRYFRGQGRTKSIRLGEDTAPWYRKPRWLWKTVVREWGAYLMARASGDTARWSRRFRSANLATGRLFG